MPRIGFEKFIRNKTQTATLFVDLNKVPMHEIDLLVHRIAVLFFASTCHFSFLSSLLCFCFVSSGFYIAYTIFKARRALTTGYLFSSVSFPCLRVAFARVSSRLHFFRFGQRGFKTPPFTGHEVNCFLTCASNTFRGKWSQTGRLR